MVGNVGGGGHLEFWTAAGWPSQGQHLTPCSICRVSRASQRSVCYGWCNRRYCSPHIHYKTKVSYSSSSCKTIFSFIIWLVIGSDGTRKCTSKFLLGEIPFIFIFANKFLFSVCHHHGVQKSNKLFDPDQMQEAPDGIFGPYSNFSFNWQNDNLWMRKI